MLSKHDFADVAGAAPIGSSKGATVAVVIPTYNHAHFLSDALISVLTQTRPVDEIIVVDDGSTDDPESVVARFPNVQLIRQENRGLASARNAGLRVSNATYITFLDADDRLLTRAIEAGLACFARQPGCAFVYGGYRHISEAGEPISNDRVTRFSGNAHLFFLRGNPIQMHGTVLYHRDSLLAVGGFDDTLRWVEDYDVYLRIAQKFPVGSHSITVAEYRQHGKNMSHNLKKMYLGGRAVLARHKVRIASDAPAIAVLEERLASRRVEYARRMLGAAGANWRTHRKIGKVLLGLAQAARLSPFLISKLLLRSFFRRAILRVDRSLPASLSDLTLTRLRFVLNHGYVPRLKKPVTFSEWVNSKKLFDRNPLLTTTADKVAVRDYVRDRCGDEILIPLLQVVDRVEEINFEKFADSFVLKAAHASGLVQVIRSKASIDENELRRRLKLWLEVNYYQYNREWQYKHIPPRIIVEQALLDADRQPPPDYKLFVFRGTVRLIQLDVGRFVEHRRSLFDREWRLLNVIYRFPSAGDQPKPSRLAEMIVTAEILGREFEFARIDLYEHQNRIYFGEITHTPEAGLGNFDPKSFDRTLGEILTSGDGLAPSLAQFSAFP